MMAENKSPYEVVCPKRRAARTVRCLEPVKDGSRFVEQPHTERIELANGEGKTN